MRLFVGGTTVVENNNVEVLLVFVLFSTQSLIYQFIPPTAMCPWRVPVALHSYQHLALIICLFVFNYLTLLWSSALLTSEYGFGY